MEMLSEIGACLLQHNVCCQQYRTSSNTCEEDVQPLLRIVGPQKPTRIYRRRLNAPSLLQLIIVVVAGEEGKPSLPSIRNMWVFTRLRQLRVDDDDTFGVLFTLLLPSGHTF
ncbi:hypothetical protein Tcan_00912, partial [Toxocara canis]